MVFFKRLTPHQSLLLSFSSSARIVLYTHHTETIKFIIFFRNFLEIADQILNFTYFFVIYVINSNKKVYLSSIFIYFIRQHKLHIRLKKFFWLTLGKKTERLCIKIIYYFGNIPIIRKIKLFLISPSEHTQRQFIWEMYTFLIYEYDATSIHDIWLGNRVDIIKFIQMNCLLISITWISKRIGQDIPCFFKDNRKWIGTLLTIYWYKKLRLKAIKYKSTEYTKT